MSRKDYVKLAAVIREAVAYEYDAAAVRFIAEELADVLQADNPRFDRDRFFAAAGI